MTCGIDLRGAQRNQAADVGATSVWFFFLSDLADDLT